ncbi:MAG: hypothetical protein CSA21_07085 [Deltaproteobacteria bacterium]|nr:MAG: hypothetical protein CSA21_07085 [Deltaproteobacteria bacterium]
MIDKAFSWFPQLVNEEVVVVLVESNSGIILNTDGKNRHGTDDNNMYIVFTDNDEARAWSMERVKRNPEIMCLIYNQKYEVEYIGFDDESPENNPKAKDNNISFIRKIMSLIWRILPM